MFKLFLLILVALGIYALWLHIQKLKAQSNTPTTDNTVPMVQCRYCSSYTPVKNAIKGSDNQWYCCIEHLKKAEQ